MARKSRKNQAEQEMTYAVALYIRTALYIRLSVEDNKKRGNSIDTQKMVLENFIAGKPEFLVHEIYIDNGFSGTNTLRPAFQKMLADIEAGKVNCVIVKDLSRLGRNSIDTGFYMERYFPANKVRFISVTDQYDSDNPDNLHGGIILPLKNMINEAYSLDIGRKIKAQARQAMKDGEFVGGRTPYGYHKDPTDCHKLLVDEEAAAVVRQIFQWAYDKVGINEIVKRLNQAGILPPSNYKQQAGVIKHENLVGSGMWQTRTVAKILDTETYTGDMVQGKTKTVDHRQVRAGAENLIAVPGTHEAIVSREMFEAVRAYRQQVAEDAKQRKVDPYTPNIFKGKVFCAHCGGNLHRQRNKRKKGPDVYIFHCLTNSRVLKGSCEGVTMNEHELMPVVVASLKKQLTATLKGYATELQGEAEQEQRLDIIGTSLSQSKERLLTDRKYVHGLYDNLARGILSDDEYNMLKVRYDADIAATLAEISELEKGLAALKGQIARYAELREDMKALNRSRRLSAGMVDRLVERIDIDHDHKVTVTASFAGEFKEHSEVWKKCVNM